MSDVTHRGSLLGWKISAAKHYAHRRSHRAETTETIATAITNGGHLSICCVRVPSGYECRCETGPGRMGRLCGVYVQPVASAYAASAVRRRSRAARSSVYECETTGGRWPFPTSEQSGAAAA